MGILSSIFGRKKLKLSDIVNKTIPMETLKKRTRIAVIDDDVQSLPINNLKEDGFAIDYFDSINTSVLKRLLQGDFDIIVLDIKGVVKPDLIQDDGLGILKYLKEKNPMQLIIACSSQQFDPTASKFFNLADDVLNKPITFVKCKETLEQIIQDKMTAQSRWNGLEKYLLSLQWDKKQIDNLEQRISRSLQNHDSQPPKNILEHLKEHSEAYTLICHIIELIYKLGYPQ